MIYVDTSVIVALMTVEPKTPSVTTWFAELCEIPIASDWLLTEFHSAISMKLRTGQLKKQHAKRIREEFEIMVDGGLRLIPVSRTAFALAAKMVQQTQTGLRAGDSLHLAVALEVGATYMATLDEILAVNCRQHGMNLVSL